MTPHTFIKVQLYVQAMQAKKANYYNNNKLFLVKLRFCVTLACAMVSKRKIVCCSHTILSEHATLDHHSHPHTHTHS